MEHDSGTNVTRRPVRAGWECQLAWVGVLGIGLAAASCGGSQSQDSQASARELAELLDTPGTLTPSGPAAASYASEPVEARHAGSLGDPLRVAIVDSVKNSGAQAGIVVAPDRRLDAAMNDLARTLRAGEQPHWAAVQFLLGHYGIVEPYPTIQVLMIDDATNESAAGEFLKQFSLPTRDKIVKLGVGISRATTQWTLLAAVQPKLIDLAPVKRAQPAGGAIEVSGKFLARLTEPLIHVTDPNGKPHRVSIAGASSEFTATLQCRLGDGRYQIELTGRGDRGPEILASMAVFCGAAPPDEFDGKAGFVEARVPVGEAEAQLLTLLNQSRAHVNLPALTLDPALSKVARRHSEDMLTNKFVGGESPTAGSIAEQVTRAGLSPGRITANVSSASSPDEAHGSMMRSPSDRTIMLDADVTHVGIGVVFSQPGAGPLTLLATEIFR